MKTSTISTPKTVGIVTLYKAFNHGAFLQAYALQKFLKEEGCKVYFIDVYDRKHNFLTIKTLKPTKENIIKSTAFNFKKLLTFRNHQKKFHTTNHKANNFDAVILGSDEIWNIKNPTFSSKPEFFGAGINTKTLISYAPSAATSTGEDIVKHSSFAEGLKSIDFYSARDKNALDIIEKSTGKNGLRVLDPTFLTEIEDDHLDIGFEKFIAIYSYNFNPALREEVKEFAYRKGLPIISLGFFAAWCDKSVNANPFQFMNILKRAEHVITDTFHGTILSVQLKKNLAVYAQGKEKIEDFLDYYCLTDRMVSKKQSLDRILKSPINASDLKAINSQLALSKNFLRSALFNPCADKNPKHKAVQLETL